MIPLIEETHADLLSTMTSSLYSSPSREIFNVKQRKETRLTKSFIYTINLYAAGENNPSRYEPQFRDLVALTSVRPKCIRDLSSPKTPFTLALVSKASAYPSLKMQVISSKAISFEKRTKDDKLFVVCLTNLNTNIRIWDALNPGKGGNMSIFTSVLSVGPSVSYAASCIFFM